MQMRWIEDALAAACGLGMDRHLGAAMMDANATFSDDHLHALADQPPRHAVAVAVDFDRTIGLYSADQLAHLSKGRPAVEWFERGSLVPRETRQRRLAGRAMHPAVGDLAHPPLRCASNAAQLSKTWPAIALRLT